MDTQAVQDQFERNKGDFILTEIETGCTFAKLARDARDPDKLKRNLKNARKAYDTASRFLSKNHVEDEQLKAKLTAGLANLKHDLLRLGEKFAE